MARCVFYFWLYLSQALNGIPLLMEDGWGRLGGRYFYFGSSIAFDTLFSVEIKSRFYAVMYNGIP